MIFYYINGVDRSQDITESSLNIRLGLNRRSNSTSFEMFRGSKPSGNQIVKIYQGGLVDSISGNDIILKDTYELGYNTFRPNQTITLGVGEVYEYNDIITAYNESTRTLTMQNTVNVSLVQDNQVGEIIFGGTVSRVVDENLHSLTNLVYPVTCVGYEKLFDKKFVSDTWVDVDSRYIINDILNTTVNFNRTIDNMSYANNTAIQASWIESGDGLNPTVDTNYIEGSKSAKFSWTNSGGTAEFRTTFTAKDLSQLTQTGTGVPTDGQVMLWVKGVTNVTNIQIKLGVDSSNYILVDLPFESETDWQYITAKLATGTITGTVNWTLISFASIIVTQTGDGFSLFNGFRVNATNSFTAKNLSPTVVLDEYRSPQIRPSQILNTLAKAYEFTWYIDFEQDIHFKAKDVQPCYYNITDTSNNFYELETELDESQLGNRITIEGGDRTSASIYSQAIQGNGAVREWIMKSKFKNLEVYEDNNTSTDTMEAGTNTTTVNATAHGLTTGEWIVNRTRNEAREVTVVTPDQFTVLAVQGQTSGDTFSKFATQKTVGVEGINDDASFDYMSNFNEKSIRNSEQTDTIPSTTYLLFRYNEVIPLSIQYTDSASANALKALGLGDGIFDLDKVTDNNITDTVTAITLAQAKTNEYSNPVITGSFKTNYHGFKIGDLVQVNEVNRALNGEYLIQKISMQQKNGEYQDHFNYSIEFGTTLFGAIEFFQKLLSQGDGLEINTDSVVETFVNADEVCEVSDVNTIYKYGGNWKFEPSTGQPVPSRYDLASYS